jgi:hypothetical protein
MDLPSPPAAVAALAEFVRERLTDVSGAFAPLWTRRDGVEVLPAAGPESSSTVLTTARQFAMVVVCAAAPFAPTSYSRMRLIRQMHASGLLSADELHRAGTILDHAERGAPR